MKKIIILGIITIFFANLETNGACLLEKLESCKADIGAGINDRLQDKIVPNNIDQLKQPKNTFNNRTKLGQPQIPENINMEPIQEENTQPYDANCQFGNCFNRTQAGEKKN